MDLRQLVTNLTLLTEKLESLVVVSKKDEVMKTPQYFVSIAQLFIKACTGGDLVSMKDLHKQHRLKIQDEEGEVTLTGFPGWSYMLDMDLSSFICSIREPKCLKFLHKHCNLKRESIRKIGYERLKSPLQDHVSVAFSKWFTPKELITDIKVGNIVLFRHLWDNGVFQDFDDFCACMQDVVVNDHLQHFQYIIDNVKDKATMMVALEKSEMGTYGGVNILNHMISNFTLSADHARSILVAAAKHGQCDVLICLKQYFGLSTLDHMHALEVATKNGQAVGVQTLLCTYDLTMKEDEFRNLKDLAVVGNHWDVVAVLVACSVNCLV